MLSRSPLKNDPDVVSRKSSSSTVNSTLPLAASTSVKNAGSLASIFYEQFFPTRPNVSPMALADAVTNPGKTTSSFGKSFGQVAKDARASIDAAYRNMTLNGPPVSENYRDLATSMSALDRRSLYAVSSNEGQYFTKDEQAGARFLMGKQQELAMGFLVYPDSMMTVDRFAGHESDRFKNLSEFLANVSPEEKQSGNWIAQSSEATRRSSEQEDGIDPENLAISFMEIVFGEQYKEMSNAHYHSENSPLGMYDFLSEN